VTTRSDEFAVELDRSAEHSTNGLAGLPDFRKFRLEAVAAGTERKVSGRSV
jgi:hypothetical protein